MLRILTFAAAIVAAAPVLAGTLPLHKGHGALKAHEWKASGQITIESIGWGDPTLHPHLFHDFPSKPVRRIALVPRDNQVQCKSILATFREGPSYDFGPKNGYFAITAPEYAYVRFPEGAGQPVSLVMPCIPEGDRVVTVDVFVDRDQEDTTKWSFIDEIRTYSSGGKLYSHLPPIPIKRIALKPLDAEATCIGGTVTYAGDKTHPLDLNKVLPADKLTVIDLPAGGGEVRQVKVVCSPPKRTKGVLIIVAYAPVD